MVFRGQDLWRRAPIFKWGFTDVLPGFREGAALFAVYWAVDTAMSKFGGKADHGHGHAAASHGSEHDAKPAAAHH